MKNWYKRIATATSMFLLAGMLSCSSLAVHQKPTRAPKGKTYALIMADRDDSAPVYFYDSAKLVYGTLIKQKVDPENIEVLYRSEKGLEDKIIDGIPTKTNIKNALAEYSNLSENDMLIIYRAGHGGLTWTEGKDGEPVRLSEMQLEGYDYSIPSLKEPNRITQEEFAEMIKNIKAKKVVILQQCHTGGFTEITKDLKKTVVIGAERKAHTTKKWPLNKYWDLTKYISAAISGELNKKSIDADTDGDDLVSIVEAYEFSVKNMPAAIMGFVETHNNLGNYSAYKEKPQFGSSEDLDPNTIILGDYTFKDKNLPPDKTLDLRQKTLGLIKHAVEKGEKGETTFLGVEYLFSRGEYTFSVMGRFFPQAGTPKTAENFIPLAITVLHTIKIDPKTGETLKQRIIPDGKVVPYPNVPGKFSFSGCDSEPDSDTVVTKSRDKEGLLEINREEIELNDKEFKEYISMVNYLYKGI